MKKQLFCMIMILLFSGALFIGCPGNKDTASEKGTIEKKTEETGKELADQLSAPIDKARDVVEQAEDRLNHMVDQMKEQ